MRHNHFKAAQAGANAHCRGLPAWIAESRDVTMGVMKTPDSRARWLDLEASIELQHGHHAQAERLAQAAAELRGAI